MKFLVTLLLALTFSHLTIAADIETTRSGELIIKSLNRFTTVVSFPVKAIKIKDSLPKKYILMSNGSVSSPMGAGNCRAYQVYQSSLYNGEISSIAIAVQDSTGAGNCPELLKSILSENLHVIFGTALLGDGSGVNIGPVSVTILNK